jgi:hypothetical protein
LQRRSHAAGLRFFDFPENSDGRGEMIAVPEQKKMRLTETVHGSG